MHRTECRVSYARCANLHTYAFRQATLMIQSRTRCESAGGGVKLQHIHPIFVLLVRLAAYKLNFAANPFKEGKENNTMIHRCVRVCLSMCAQSNFVDDHGTGPGDGSAGFCEIIASSRQW